MADPHRQPTTDAASGRPADAHATPSPARLRLIALDAARSVAPALTEAFRTGAAAAGTKTNHHDLVTVHDAATEHALVEALTAAVPGSRVLGEELGTSGPAEPSDAHDPHGTHNAHDTHAPHDDAACPAPASAPGVLWIVDPIDGTSNFSHGFAMFSVSIAAEVDSEVVAGIVLDPATGLEFSADDVGAWLNDRPLAEVGRPSPGHDERRLNVVTSYPAAEALAREGTAALERFGHLVTTYATVRRVVSGALELCHAAAGWADVVLGVDTNPWDVAAAQLILTRAGGRYIALGSPGDAAGTGNGCADTATDTATDTDTAADATRPAPHRAPHYVGLAPGRAAPTAEALALEIVAARREEPPH